mgnify:CR=1 FL=1
MYYGYLFGIGPTKKLFVVSRVRAVVRKLKAYSETIGIVGWVRLSRPVKPYRGGKDNFLYHCY